MKKIILVLCLCFILISCNKAKTPEESIDSDEPIDEVTPTVSEEKTEYEEILRFDAPCDALRADLCVGTGCSAGEGGS